MKQILDELLKVLITLIVIAISYKYYELNSAKTVKGIEAKKSVRLLENDITQLPKRQLLLKLIEMQETEVFSDKTYFLKVLDAVITKDYEDLVIKFFLPAANEDVIGAIMYKCIKANYFACVATILGVDPLVEYDGKNVLHMIAELNRASFMELVPKHTLYLHLRDKTSGEVPMKYVRSQALANHFTQRYEIEFSKSPYKKELTAHLNYMHKYIKVNFINHRQRINAMFADSSWYPKKFKFTLKLLSRNTVFEDSFNRLHALGNSWYSSRSLEEFTILLEEGGSSQSIELQNWIRSLLKTFFKATFNTDVIMLPLFDPIKTGSELNLYAPQENYSPKHYKFAGSIVALALQFGIPLNVEFIPSIYRLMLNIEPYRIDDLVIQDPIVYNNFKLSREAYIKIKSVTMYDYETRANVRVRSFKDIDTRYDRYASNVLYYKQKQFLDAFAAGFRSKIPREITKYLDLNDLKSALKGTLL